MIFLVEENKSNLLLLAVLITDYACINFSFCKYRSHLPSFKFLTCFCFDFSLKKIFDLIGNRFAPSPDPSLTIKFYKRSPEQQAALGYLVDPSQLGESCDEESIEEIKNPSDQMKGEPHGSIGAAAGHRAIAQVNSAEIAENLFRYSTPEEV